MNERIALLVGATGLVGGHALDELLDDDRWKRIVVLARRPLGRVHGKLEAHVVDFDALPTAAFRGVEDVFVCLGTTMKVAGSREAFRRVDHDYALAVARLAREAGASRLGLVSSIGASESTSNFYLRVKGETERDIRELHYATFVVAQPGLLLGDRREPRLGERLGEVAMSVAAPLLRGRLRKYRAADARLVAAAMIDAVARGNAGMQLLLNDDFERSR